MPPRSIPSPELIGETLEGAVYDVSGRMILLLGAPPAAWTGRSPLLHGSLTVRYALPLVTPPSDAVIPGLFAAEKGGILVGREAWDYIQEHFQIHPRADVIGKRPDGSDIQVFLREVDLGRDVRVFVFTSPEAAQPACEVTGLVVGTGAPAPTPALLSKYLPLVQNLDATGTRNP